MLNPQQQKAVETTQGKVLVLAGAGSGKTKVIVHRIAYLIQEKQVPAESILGLTFTNKAAEEMKGRLGKIIPPSVAKKVLLSTFHSFCMQVLRKEIHYLGYTKNFSLYDEKDTGRLLKQLARETLEQEGELPSIQPIMENISYAKNRREAPKDPMSQLLFDRLHRSMQTFNAVDFDSLLTLTIELFEKHPQVLTAYQERFRYIMIDEYQDTNPVQYQIAELLSAKYQNLCVVGDDDQSIYGWRGAEIKNILSFVSSHVIKLEQNYRSLPIILKAANLLIAHNSQRHKKELYSHAVDSQPITLFHAPTEVEEATTVIQRLLHLKKVHHLQFSDFAILYRSNTVVQAFELALMQGMWQKNNVWQKGIPYQVFGGLQLYERSEVKDLMAYLRFIHNPKDEEALLRIINVPRRGISDKTLSLLTEENRKQGIPLWQYIKEGNHSVLSDKSLQSLQAFIKLIETAQTHFATSSLKNALSQLIETIHYQKAIEEDVKSPKMRQFKWENVQNCISLIEMYEKQTDTASLEDFLSSTLLNQSAFPHKKECNKDRVNLMTFHSAKGLEFEAVFLVGLEDGIIPHEKSIQEKRLEEERRLMYVAITRAKKHLTLSMARQRKRYGKEQESTPSRFLLEIPKELFQIVNWKTPY